MGRAYEVRKKDIQKTGAAKAKLYSMYAREIYQAAKNGGADPTGNPSLKRLIDRAKKEQVPADIINRAIDKVNSGVDESYDRVSYEIFGPAGSTVIVECLTDNVNRSISDVKAVLNKCKCKIGVQGSVSFNYDHLCIIGLKGISEEEIMDAIIMSNLDIEDIETDQDMVIIYGDPKDSHALKEALEKINPNIEFDIDEISMLPKDKIDLDGENLELFNRLLTMLEDIDDANHIYHNVNLS